MINLLPTTEKESLLREENWRLILVLGILTFVFLISLILVLFSIKIHVVSEFKSQEILFEAKEKEFQKTELYGFRTKIQETNQILTGLDTFFQERDNSADLFEKICQLLPKGVHLNNFSHESLDNSEEFKAKIFLSGIALTQQDLLDFINNLDKEKSFCDTDLPLSSWVEFNNINFTLNFKIVK